MNIFNLDETLYLTEGGEAKIFFGIDQKHVIKLNDAVYYNNWLDFFNSILIHNQIFPETSYKLNGFIVKDNILFAVLEQNFILSNEEVDLDEIESLLSFNGFQKIKRNDFYNKGLGILLEDIHDENVINKMAVTFLLIPFLLEYFGLLALRRTKVLLIKVNDSMSLTYSTAFKKFDKIPLGLTPHNQSENFNWFF